MALPNIFTKDVADQMVARMAKLSPNTQPQWGKMNAGQMLAHCNVAYDMAFTDKYPKPNAIARFMLKMLVKDSVCSEKPYPKNGRTAPAFIITDDRNFDAEKTKLKGYLNKCADLGPTHFDGKESNSFGKMTTTEWNNQFYKHLDHHLTQFGV